MKKITLTTVLFLLSLFCFAQDTEPPSTPTNLVVDNQVGVLSWTSSTDNVEVMEYDVYVDDVYNLTINHYPSASNGMGLHTLGILSTGNSYTLKVLARDTSGNESAFSNYTSFVAADPSNLVLPNQLFITRIMNGDNNNKSIEILNISGYDADMSEYSLKISHDGNPTWDATYTFPPNLFLDSSDKIRIGHSQSLPCDFEINVVTNDIITNFDGNDVIGLFHNDVLIDRLGYLGQVATYINDNMLAIRTYYVDQHTPWSQLAPPYGDICEGFLGENYYLLSTPEVTEKNIAMYPNPVKGNSVYVDTKNNQTIDNVTILDINGRNVLTSTKIMNNQIDILNIKQGVYFVKIQSGNKISTHKLIRQ
jgi:hypothetical protein